jgi:undecaprenyl-diphosphatase
MFLDYYEAVFLGFLQGIAEWLPISSSGHLVLFQHFFDLNTPLFFDASLHLGTILVIILIYHKDVVAIMKSLLRGDIESPEGREGLLLIIGTIPAVLTGLIFQSTIEALFYNIEAVAFAFIITGFLLYATKRFKDGKNLTSSNAFLIGVAQAVAIIPGISRSGATVSVGIIKGVEGEKAVKFSFLLAIPAIIGAAIIEAGSMMHLNYLMPVLVGTVISMIAGYASYRILVRFVRRKGLHYFSYYCWVIGVITLLYTIL